MQKIMIATNKYVINEYARLSYGLLRRAIIEKLDRSSMEEYEEYFLSPEYNWKEHNIPESSGWNPVPPIMLIPNSAKSTLFVYDGHHRHRPIQMVNLKMPAIILESDKDIEEIISLGIEPICTHKGSPMRSSSQCGCVGKTLKEHLDLTLERYDIYKKGIKKYFPI